MSNTHRRRVRRAPACPFETCSRPSSTPARRRDGAPRGRARGRRAGLPCFAVGLAAGRAPGEGGLPRGARHTAARTAGPAQRDARDQAHACARDRAHRHLPVCAASFESKEEVSSRTLDRDRPGADVAALRSGQAKTQGLNSEAVPSLRASLDGPGEIPRFTLVAVALRWIWRRAPVDWPTVDPTQPQIRAEARR